MVEEIAENLYKIEIPLPKNPLRSLNSYVVKGLERNLIIDTGWNQKECMEAMQAALSKLTIDIRETSFFITHLHTDHMGLLSQLVTDTSTIYFSRPDGERIRSGISWEDFAGFARLNGFPEAELQRVLDSHPGFKFRSKEPLRFQIVKEGDTIRIANYRFRCVATSGHTKGHMCLYEPNKKVFVAGDHILGDITPTILLMSLSGMVEIPRLQAKRIFAK